MSDGGMEKATRAETGEIPRSAALFLQVLLLPPAVVASVAAVLIWGLGLEPSGQLTRGLLYGVLFLACGAVGSWKFSLEGTGITSKNIGRGFLYAGVILVIGLAFILALQPPVEWADLGPAIWSPVLFHLAVALAEETWFRGLILKALHTWRGALVAVFGSALLFGVTHVPAHGWEGLLFSLSIGLPYAVVRLKTGNLLGLIVVHWVTNLTDSFVLLSPANLGIVWLVVLHISVFSGASVLILWLDRLLRRQYHPGT